MLFRRLLFSGVLVIWFLFIAFLQGTAVEFHHTYEHWLAPLSRPGRPPALAPLTELVLPLLDGNAWQFYAYFWTLMLVPLVLVIRLWWIRDRLELLEWFCYGFGVYLAVFIASVFVIVSGLWAAFALL